MSITITGLPNLGSIADNTYIPTETAGVTGKTTAQSIRNYVYAGTPTSFSAVNGVFTTIVSVTDYATNFSTGNAQITGGNITGLYNLGTVNFNASSAQITSGNVTGLTNLSTVNFTASSATINGGSISATTIVGNLTGNSSGTVATYTGNVTAGNLLSNGSVYGTNATLTGAVNATNFNGTLYGSVYGGSVYANIYGNVVATTVSAATIGNTGTTLTGTLSTAAQTNITSVGTLTALTVSGATQTAAITSSGTVIAAVINASTIGNSGATLTGTLSTAAQTNITSVGTLTNLQTSSLGVGTAASGTSGEIRATNNITAYYSSDAQFKENIRPVPDALGIVTQIGSDLFEWTDAYIAEHGGEDGYFIQKSDFGVVAQKVQRVFPQAIRTRPDGSLAVDYEKLATLSFGAIEQLLARVEALETTVMQLTSNSKTEPQ